MKTAMIFGVTGQDGSHLADFLLSKGYEVHGVRRRNATFNTSKIDHLIESDLANKQFFLHYGDVTDSSNINRLISEIKPDELYNLAANSHVRVSFDIPEYTADVDGLGALRIVEAVRVHSPHTKVYFASTSECFGGQFSEMPANGFNEDAPFHPRSPYGVAKLYGHWICRHYREAYGLFTCCGILFNHSSYRRGETFLTRKITYWLGNRPEPVLRLGNLYSNRDEGHSYDYIQAMWLMLQHDKPDDYVIATGKTNTIKNWVELCFNKAGMTIEWQGNGLDEKGIVNGKQLITIDPCFFRPAEVDYLLGDSSKARDILGWKPTHNLEDIAQEMVNFDCHNKLPDYIR